jgi:hypothetical protein
MNVASNQTHGTFAQFIESVEPSLRPICIALREAIAEVHPAVVEVVWQRQRIASYGVGPKKMSEHYAYIGAQKSYVNLGFYRGTSLTDPGKMLEGTGKGLRHVKIRSISIAQSAPVMRLLREAIAERQAHFHET